MLLSFTSLLCRSDADHFRYVKAAQGQLKSFIDKYGDDGKEEINNVCTAHTITLDIDTENKVRYNGCVVSPEGQLVILFGEDYLAVNIDSALAEPGLVQALNDAPTASSSMSYVARESIQSGWEREADSIKKIFAELLQTEITLEPNFQSLHDTLKASSDGIDQWETNIGSFARFYFEALASGLKSQNFDSDEMMREAISEAMEKGVIALRIVDKSQMKANYNESVFEDGVLYMQVSKVLWR